jgi:hypothetical protein
MFLLCDDSKCGRVSIPRKSSHAPTYSLSTWIDILFKKPTIDFVVSYPPHFKSNRLFSYTIFSWENSQSGRSLRNGLPLAVFHFHSFLHRFPGIDSVKVRHSDNVSRKGLSVGYGFTWYTVVSFEQVEKMTRMATEKGFHSVLFYSLVLSSSPPFLF